MIRGCERAQHRFGGIRDEGKNVGRIQDHRDFYYGTWD